MSFSFILPFFHTLFLLHLLLSPSFLHSFFLAFFPSFFLSLFFVSPRRYFFPLSFSLSVCRPLSLSSLFLAFFPSFRLCPIFLLLLTRFPLKGILAENFSACKRCTKRVLFCAREVVDLLKVSTGKTSGPQQMLLNRPLCQNAFRRLLGIGAGRYTRLKRAAVLDKPPPLDGRCIKRPFIANKRVAAAKRACIVEFLTELESTLSEPMPEANQSTTRLRAAAMKIVAEGEGDSQAAPAVAQKMKFRRNRGRRPRLAGLLHRGKDFTGLRLLPPGSLTDYLALLHAKYPDQKVSLKLFSQALCFELARCLGGGCKGF